jgi:hypothetical protein
MGVDPLSIEAYEARREHQLAIYARADARRKAWAVEDARTCQTWRYAPPPWRDAVRAIGASFGRYDAARVMRDADMLWMSQSGWSQRQIAAQIGRTPSRVQQIMKQWERRVRLALLHVADEPSPSLVMPRELCLLATFGREWDDLRALCYRDDLTRPRDRGWPTDG